MGEVVADISISLNGFVAGPDDGLGRGLGEGGEPIHNWVMGGSCAPTRRSSAGCSRTPEPLWSAAGCTTCDGWGEGPAFPFPVFVVPSRPHEPGDVGGGSAYTFVTEGIRAALDRATQAPGEKSVSIGGGARVIQHYPAAGPADELNVHLAPVLTGRGVRLFENLGDNLPRLVPTGSRQSPNATHLGPRLVHEPRDVGNSG